MDGQSAQGVPLALPIGGLLGVGNLNGTGKASGTRFSSDRVFRWYLQLKKIEISILERKLQQSRPGGTLTQETIQ
jgi:hypothetical protein